nr:MAG TPA: core protein [Caudoviricetes sp.]
MKKHLSIAERQERLNRRMKVVEFILPIIVSAITAALLSIMVLR